ncbi:MAG: 50S ribosomal protein L9 [Nitrospirales bacterium]|nr:50S ribosomal protein L9 [Nitrospirales bacterium]
MKVILQKNVDNLGYVGDILDVANGYGRNYLLPRGMALEANSRNVKALDHIKRQTAQKAQTEKSGWEDLASKLSKVALTFPVKTGKEDKLFGSVTTKDLEEGLAEQGFEVDRKKIHLAHPIKELGNLTVSIKLYRDVTATISVNVVKIHAEGEESAAKAEEHSPSDATESTASAETTPAPQEPSEG